MVIAWYILELICAILTGLSWDNLSRVSKQLKTEPNDFPTIPLLSVSNLKTS